MSLYFMPKSRILRQTQAKWSIKWSARRNASTKSGNLGKLVQTQSSFGQEKSQKKGKFSKLNIFHTKWSWKAGAGWTILSVLDWWLLAAGGWFTWSGLLMRWTPIGACVFAAIEWHIHNRNLERKGLPKTASEFQTNVYCSMPLRLVSKAWGWIAARNVPTPLRPYLYGWYCNQFNVNLDEAAVPDMKEYRNFSEFFTRPLKENARSIDTKSPLVSPADGKVLHFGCALSSQIEQVKGVTYKIESFLGPDTWVENRNSSSYLENIKLNKDEKSCLYQCVIYLAPGDYHRFHSPAQWEPRIRRHFAGELLSVNPTVAKWLPGLFCLNERATYIGIWQYGFFSFTAVGATNVGSVQIFFDEELKTNQWIGLKVGSPKTNTYDELVLPPKIKLDKGQLVGQFNMGSTIVLLFEAPQSFKFCIEAGQQIKVGECLGYASDKKKNEVHEEFISK